MTRTRSQEEFNAVKRLAANVELTDVRPVAFYARLLDAPPAHGTRLKLDLRPSLAFRRDGTALQVWARFDLYAHPEGDKKRRFVRVHYRVAAHYVVNEGIDVTEPVVRSFAESNGMVHLWPYFRAFVTQAWAQLGLAPVALPVFRVRQAPDGASSESP